MKLLILLVALAGVGVLAKNLVTDLSNAGPQPRLTYYGDGQKKNATAYDGAIKSGPSEQWHPDGSPEWKGRYEDGLREGEWIFWREDGVVDAERSGAYRAGKKVE